MRDTPLRSVVIHVTPQHLIPWRGYEARNVISLPQPLLKCPANVLRKNHFRSFAAVAWCGRSSMLAGDFTIARDRQISVFLAGTYLESGAHDLAARIDAECEQQKKWGSSRSEVIEF